MKKRLSYHLQNAFWLIGINIHNTITDECTPNFNCCEDIYSTFSSRLKYLTNNCRLVKYIKYKFGK